MWADLCVGLVTDVLYFAFFLLRFNLRFRARVEKYKKECLLFEVLGSGERVSGLT